MLVDRPLRRSAPVLLGCLLALGYFARPAQNPNENSRLGPVLAAFWQRSLSIDAYHDTSPTHTADRSAHAGHVYSDRAPGSSHPGALGHAPLFAWERAAGREAPYLVRKCAVTVAAVALPVAIALCALSRLATAASGVRSAGEVVLVGLLGSPLLPFGSALFGHAPAGAVLFLAFALARRVARGDLPDRLRQARPTIRWTMAIGLAAALGVLGQARAAETIGSSSTTAGTGSERNTGTTPATAPARRPGARASPPTGRSTPSRA